MPCATVKWRYPNGFGNSPIELHFTNPYTRTTETRTYKTLRAARCAETKFYNRMARLTRKEN